MEPAIVPNPLKPSPTSAVRVVAWKEGAANKQDGWYTTNDLDTHQNTIFLFGDNITAKYRSLGKSGGGGQALVTRGAIEYDRCLAIGDNFKDTTIFKHGNAYGISTVVGTMTDPDFQKLMDIEFAPLEKFVRNGGKVIIPHLADGKHNLGRGFGDIKSDQKKLGIIAAKIKVLTDLGKNVVPPSTTSAEDLKKELHGALKVQIASYQADTLLTNLKKVTIPLRQNKNPKISEEEGAAKEKDRLKGQLIRYKISKIREEMENQDSKITAERKVQLREELGILIYADGAAKMSDMIVEKGEQQDAEEFLTPLFTAAFSDKHVTIKSTVTVTNKSLESVLEKASLIALSFSKDLSEQKFSKMIADFQKEENLTGDNQYEIKKDTKVDATKQFKISPNGRNELVFHLKRFTTTGHDLAENYKATKNKTPVDLNEITIEEKKYKLTAFVHHDGSLAGGHYVTYIEEVGGWYCYNDNARTKVKGDKLEEAKKQAYIVKYATKNTELPKAQTGTKNFDRVYGNRCWMNAALAFAGSFTTTTQINAAEKQNLEKLEKEILGKYKDLIPQPLPEERKKAFEKIKKASPSKATAGTPPASDSESSDLESWKNRFIGKILADKEMRGVFLNNILGSTEEDSFLEGMGEKGHEFHKMHDQCEGEEYLELFNDKTTNLNQELVTEFKIQYYEFLYRNYSPFQEENSTAIEDILSHDIEGLDFNLVEGLLQEAVFANLQKTPNDKATSEEKKKYLDKLIQFESVLKDSAHANADNILKELDLLIKDQNKKIADTKKIDDQPVSELIKQYREFMVEYRERMDVLPDYIPTSVGKVVPMKVEGFSFNIIDLTGLPRREIEQEIENLKTHNKDQKGVFTSPFLKINKDEYRVISCNGANQCHQETILTPIKLGEIINVAVQRRNGAGSAASDSSVDKNLDKYIVAALINADETGPSLLQSTIDVNGNFKNDLKEIYYTFEKNGDFNGPKFFYLKIPGTADKYAKVEVAGKNGMIGIRTEDKDNWGRFRNAAGGLITLATLGILLPIGALIAKGRLEDGFKDEKIICKKGDIFIHDVAFEVDAHGGFKESRKDLTLSEEQLSELLKITIKRTSLIGNEIKETRRPGTIVEKFKAFVLIDERNRKNEQNEHPTLTTRY